MNEVVLGSEVEVLIPSAKFVRHALDVAVRLDVAR
jgi:hypothetical protein